MNVEQIPRVRELRVVYSPQRAAGPLPLVTRPFDALSILSHRLEPECVEVCLLLMLNSNRRVIGVHELSRGTLDTCPVAPRDVFKAVLLANAAAVIIAHNHPSGDPTPSPDDTALFRRLGDGAEMLGLELLDFLIVGHGRYYSFKEARQ